LIREFVQREAAAIRNFERARQRFRVAALEPGHFLRGFEISIGMTLTPEPGVIDGTIVPDAGDDILQDAPRRDMEEHVITDDGGDPCRRRQVDR